MHDLIVPLMPLYHVKILVKIGPIVSAEISLIEIALRVHVVVWHISWNICRCIGPIFAIFLPYESASHTDNGNEKVMKAD